MSDLHDLGEFITSVGFPGAIAIVALLLNKKQRDQCREDAKEDRNQFRQDSKEDRDAYIAERNRLYAHIESMNDKHVKLYDKVVQALDDFTRRHP